MFLISYLQAVDIEPDLFEGDIRLASSLDNATEDKLREKRAARRTRHYIWTSKIVPYEISPELGKCLCPFLFDSLHQTISLNILFFGCCG